MPLVFPYNRKNAVDYALKWAYGFNPDYYNYSDIGGDCTNFVSQCLFAGSGIMNYEPVYGWYYINANEKSPSWTGVRYLYNFLVTNDKRAVFAREGAKTDMQPGDVIQLGGSDGTFYHSLIVTEIRNGRIYVSAHTYAARNKRLDRYNYEKARYLHIMGVYV